MARLLLALLVSISSLASAQQEAPLRVRLFDQITETTFSGLPTGEEGASPEVTTFDFEAPTPLWFARADGRNLVLDEGGAVRDEEGGLAGGSLRIGPGVVEDLSRALLLVPSGPMRRVRVTGRVRLEGHPDPENSTYREALRVAEHRSDLEEPAHRDRRLRAYTPLRVSRRFDPSGWDRFELSFVTGARTKTIELHALHRSGDSSDSITRFDDIVVEQTVLGPAEIVAYLGERYRPRDGQADQTPWRLRVDLGGEVRDTMLLPPPATASFPVRIAGESHGQRLRFMTGMTPDVHRGDEDGAIVVVSFESRDGDQRELARVDVDPRNERDHRRWIPVEVDLTPIAGLEGSLILSATDPDGSPEPTDALIIATPRIEPTLGEPAGLNVLLIGVDTLRADRMSAFGYSRDTTPNLSSLASEGVKFSSARSQAPWTLPSFSTMLTSLYPSVHGAGRGGHDEWTPIDPTTTSLAEVLSRVGYETQGVVANGLISPQYGLDQGFEAYRSGWVMESADRDAERVSEFIDSHRHTPWLCFWHIMDPHLPYVTADDHRADFTDSTYEGRFTSRRGAYVPFEVLDPRPGRRWFVHEGPPPPPDLEDEDRAFVHDYYDAEIAETDAAIGRVFDVLRSSGQWERTAIAFVADHGEGLGDHDHYHHGYTLFDDQVHIPMILRVPGGASGVEVERPVGSIDLAPTLLGALGVQAPPFFQGVDRLSEDAPRGDAYFIEYPTYDSSAQKGWIRGRFKYLHDPVFHTSALYDIEEDPGEKVDISDLHPEVVREARAALDNFRWENLQKGRFHLRIRGRRGQRVRLHLTTDDLFDANFATSPLIDEHDATLDLERRNLVIETTLTTSDRLEVVFWGRGSAIGVDALLDGERLVDGITLGPEAEPEPLPGVFKPRRIPTAEGAALSWPERGHACFWLEGGVEQPLPVVLSPEEIEVLRELGYAR